MDAIERAYADIRRMRVRGAGRIGRAAAQALASHVRSLSAPTPATFVTRLEQASSRLKAARPTAVSLPNAVNYVVGAARRAVASGGTVAAVKKATLDAAHDFVRTSELAVRRIGVIGAKRIVAGETILTHCNSEVVTSILVQAFAEGKSISVYVTESRPRYQGRLTAGILARRGIPTTLIVDAAARVYMTKVDKVLVGADALAANGAVINKIGTAQLALVAKEARRRFFVAAETYKLSPQTFLGELVEIEERAGEEVAPREWRRQHPRVAIRNPAFDITPPELVDLVITERGVFPPQGLVLLMRDLYPG